VKDEEVKLGLTPLF